MVSDKVRHSDYRRIEVITGVRRRRQWTASEKAQIVAESFFPGANISEVARRSGVSAGILFRWRREALSASSVSSLPVAFAPIRVAAEQGGPASCDAEAVYLKSSPKDDAQGLIEIELAGALIRVEGPVSEAALRTILAAVRGTA
jgi:transposase